jgi:ribosome maturation factor RimP
LERLLWLEERIAPTLESMGYEVVRVAISGSDGRKTLQVMADRSDGSLISVNDCEEISHALSAIFDVEEPVSGRYHLEVSSAGIDRPLTRLKDFSAFAGFEAKVETKMPVEGRKRFRGHLNGVSKTGDVLIDVEDQEFIIAMDNVKTAKLVLTDELIEATTGGFPSANENEQQD